MGTSAVVVPDPLRSVGRESSITRNGSQSVFLKAPPALHSVARSLALFLFWAPRERQCAMDYNKGKGLRRLEVHVGGGVIGSSDEAVDLVPGLFELLRIEVWILVPVKVPGRGRVELEDVDAVGDVVERGVAREDDEVVFEVAGGEVLVAEMEEAVVLFLDVHEAVTDLGLAG